MTFYGDSVFIHNELGKVPFDGTGEHKDNTLGVKCSVVDNNPTHHQAWASPEVSVSFESVFSILLRMLKIKRNHSIQFKCGFEIQLENWAINLEAIGPNEQFKINSFETH